MNLKPFILAIALVGCTSNPEVPVKWKAALIRPDGGIHATWIVESRLEPKMECWIGGQISLYADNGYSGEFARRYNPTGLVAPVGWLWKSELIEKE